jgi:molybdopterin-guanine dinucleotide biosynthesis protein A
MAGDQVPDFDAVILAGGRAARMNGSDKPSLEVGGVPLLVLVARAAAAAGARQVIVVGPERGGAVGAGLAAVAARLDGGLVTVRESPPGGGPVPALRCGLDAASAPWVALVAADLPFLTDSWLAALLALAHSSGRPGAVLVDDGQRPQWLAGCWQAGPLRAALGRYAGASLGGLLRPLEPALLGPAPPRSEHAESAPPPFALRRSGAAGSGLAGSGARPQPWLDCDDPAQLAAARAAHPAPAHRDGEA